MIKQIKKNREIIVLNNFLNKLVRESFPSIDIIEYSYVYIPILSIYNDTKIIRVRYYLFPESVKDSEYLDEYIKIYTTFVDYKIVEW